MTGKEFLNVNELIDNNKTFNLKNLLLNLAQKCLGAKMSGELFRNYLWAEHALKFVNKTEYFIIIIIKDSRKVGPQWRIWAFY